MSLLPGWRGSPAGDRNEVRCRPDADKWPQQCRSSVVAGLDHDELGRCPSRRPTGGAHPREPPRDTGDASRLGHAIPPARPLDARRPAERAGGRETCARNSRWGGGSKTDNPTRDPNYAGGRLSFLRVAGPYLGKEGQGGAKTYCAH
jgi:hypothetical protein